MAYVSVSRGGYDAQIYTNDADKLADELSRDVSKHSAVGGDERLAEVPGAAKETSTGAELARAPDHSVIKSHGHGIER